MSHSKKVNIDEIQKHFPKRAHILTYFEKGNPKEISQANDFLNNWFGQYKIVGELGCEDAHHDYKILCTEEAYKAIPKEILNHDEWFSDDTHEYFFSEEEFHALNSDDVEEAPVLKAMKLEKPLNLKKKKA